MSNHLRRFILVSLVVIIAGAVRLYAIPRLDVDYDEPVYLGDAVEYANAMRAGEFNMLAWGERTYEHPPLQKILYALVLLTQPELNRLPDNDLPRLAPIAATEAGRWNIAARYLSGFWGTLAALVLALVNPLAGFFLGVVTVVVKHTSEVYLESLPLLTSLLAGLAYLRWYRLPHHSRPSRQEMLWLGLSGAFLGMTVAGKYVYGVIGIAILIHFVLAISRNELPRHTLAQMLGWGLFSILMFFVFNPYLWPHPVSRLRKSLDFHVEFQDSRLVHMYKYPWWQPLRWLAAFSEYYGLGPASAFLVNIDTFIFVAAIIGLPRLYRTQRFFFIWFLVGLAFLLIWKTKWPQYTIMMMAPFCMAAAAGVMTTWDLARAAATRRRRHPR
jgi:4-amino-4-deoxy-L-arabinose transferase-like glycosyltransferase